MCLLFQNIRVFFLTICCLKKVSDICFSGSNYDGKADGLPPLAIVNTSYVIPDSKYWVDRRYVNCTGAETNLSDCKIGAVLVYMTGCNRETMFVDCTGMDNVFLWHNNNTVCFLHNRTFAAIFLYFHQFKTSTRLNTYRHLASTLARKHAVHLVR